MADSYLDGIFLVFEEYPLLLLHVVTSVVTTLAFNLCWKLWCKRTQKEIGKTIYSEKCPTDNKVTKKVVADFPEAFITGKGEVAHLHEDCGQIKYRKRIGYRLCKTRCYTISKRG